MLVNSLRSKFYLLGIFCLATCGALGQGMHWDSVANIKLDYGVNGFYVDSTDSTLIVIGQFDSVNHQISESFFRLDKNLNLLPFPSPPLPSAYPATAIRYKGKLYFSAGQANSLVRLDDSGWVNLCTDCSINSMYVYQDKLLLGGVYGYPWDTVNRSPLLQYGYSLVQYDGTNFSSFYGVDSVTGPGNGVYCMTEYKGELYVAGNNYQYAPPYTNYKDIFRWDGSHWKNLKHGLIGGGLDFVNDLEVLNDTLYIGGYFRTINGSPGNCIAKWDGNEWHDVPPGIIDGGGVTDLQVYKGGLMVTTTSNHIGNQYSSRLAYYKNGTWCYNTETIERQMFAAVDFYGKLLVGGGLTKVGNTPCSYMAQLVSEGSCITSGIDTYDNKDAASLNLYPNPVSEMLTVEIPKPWQATHLELRTSTGQVLDAKPLNLKGATKLTYPAQHLASGVYIVVIKTNSGNTYFSRFVKQ